MFLQTSNSGEIIRLKLSLIKMNKHPGDYCFTTDTLQMQWVHTKCTIIVIQPDHDGNS